MSSVSPHGHPRIILIFTIFSSLPLLPVLSATPVSEGTNDDDTIEIGTADDLILFSNSVNSGANYSNKTVLLTADIDFGDNSSEHFYPIGNSTKSWFSGTFDGQGYIINNLKIAKGSNYSFGVFGYTKGGTFKNVVLDPSCEVVCQVNNTVLVSGIVGFCQTTACSISNSVNMASVLFNGTNIGPPLHIGGIAGEFQGYATNCANYGTITVSSNNSVDVYIGGVAGYSSKGTIANCINYGEIRYTGSTNGKLRMGGILGYWNTKVKTTTNCVNMGKMTVSGTANNSYIGNLVGYSGKYNTISNCYWDDTIGYNYIGYDEGGLIASNVSSFNSVTLQLNKSVTAGDYTENSLIAGLNAFAATNTAYSLWVSNGNKNSISFNINNRASPLLTTDKSVILLPSLLNENNVPSTEWFSDKCFTTPFNEPTIPAGTTRLYGLWDGFVPEEGCDNPSSSTTSSSSSTILSEYVEIVFNKKDLTREEATETIKEITGNDNFEIVKFEVDENGELKVVVKFDGIEGAKTFMRGVENHMNEGINNHIAKAGFTEFTISMSPKMYANNLIIAIILL